MVDLFLLFLHFDQRKLVSIIRSVEHFYFIVKAVVTLQPFKLNAAMRVFE